jgi:ABC-type transport system involved in cytochrome bd biosynthesis fused ATPase/permease subunit
LRLEDLKPTKIDGVWLVVVGFLFLLVTFIGLASFADSFAIQISFCLGIATLGLGTVFLVKYGKKVKSKYE